MRKYRFPLLLGVIIFILLKYVIINELIFQPAYAQGIGKATPVKVANPQRGKIEQQTTYTGNLEADAMVEIYASAPGKLVLLDADEGDRVKAGAVLAKTDARELLLALEQAEAAFDAAEAQLTTVEATAQIRIESQAAVARAALDAAKAQFEQAKAMSEVQTTSQLKQAKAAVAVAEANLEKAKGGARSQEIEQAKAALAGAKAGLDNAKANLDRVQTLHQQAAISDQSLDNAQAQFAGAEVQYESAAEQLSLVQEGARPEDISAAEAQLQQAQASHLLAGVAVDTEDWNTKITQARSQVLQAEANLIAAQELVEIEAWKHDITQTQAQRDQTYAKVNLAKKRLADATITSPVDGVVVNRTADIGDYASAANSPGGSPILTIVKMDVVKAVFTVSEVDLNNISVGSAVNISIGDLDTTGTIDFISPIVNPQDRTVKVKAEIPNPNYQLKPGMFVEVTIDLSASEDSLLLPREAVLGINDGQGHIFVVENGRARQQSVKIGIAYGEHISIVEGVADSTPVIVNGHRQVADGTEIVIVK